MLDVVFDLIKYIDLHYPSKVKISPINNKWLEN